MAVVGEAAHSGRYMNAIAIICTKEGNGSGTAPSDNQ